MMDTAQFFFTENNSSYSKCHTGMIKSHQGAVSLYQKLDFSLICSLITAYMPYALGLGGIHSTTQAWRGS